MKRWLLKVNDEIMYFKTKDEAVFHASLIFGFGIRREEVTKEILKETIEAFGGGE